MTRGGIETVFRPRSIAVIGASRRRGAIGRGILDNLLEYDVEAVVYPVNPKAEFIHGIKCYPSVKAIPDEIDLAIIAVPKKLVPGVMEECGEAGVKSAVIITAGFREVGDNGRKLEEQVLSIARRWGIRVVGPNCMGVINMDEGISMNATFASSTVQRGRVSFISQSGALGIAILDYMADLNMGISKFVSIGNGADISVAEIIDYLAEDENTDVILLYMEGFGNTEEFMKAVRKAVPKKPVIAVKSGRTAAGARAASSHTGSLAGADEYAEALFRQSGIIRAYSMEELFDMAMAFSCQPPPTGKNIAVVTNGGGPGILTADAVSSNGLRLAEFREKTLKILRENLPDEAAIRNPVDMIASATEKSYEIAIRAVSKDKNVDGIIVIFVPPEHRDPLVIARVIYEMSTKTKKPILGVFMGREDVLSRIQALGGPERVPVYMFPESAARSMRALYDYGKNLRDREFTLPSVEVNVDAVKEVLDGANVDSSGYLSLQDVAKMLDAAGIHQPEWAYFPDGEDIDPAGAGLEFPLALKVEAEGLIHKSDMGAVALNIADIGSLKKKVNSIKRKLMRKGYTVKGYFLQQMAPGGHELIMGMKRYAAGPLLMFGAGGIFVEYIKDVSFGVCPLSIEDADDMIKSIKSYPILMGARGGKKADINSVRDTLLKLAAISSQIPEIAEADFNPCLAYPNGVSVVDARIRITK